MAEVDNKQVLFKGYIERTPEETDMEIKVSKIKLEAPKGSGAFLVKNLYLSCDPYMRGRMRDVHDSYIPAFVPGQVIEPIIIIPLCFYCCSCYCSCFCLGDSLLHACISHLEVLSVLLRTNPWRFRRVWSFTFVKIDIPNKLNSSPILTCYRVHEIHANSLSSMTLWK